MNDKKVKDLMVPLDEYPVVEMNATLLDVVNALAKAIKSSLCMQVPARLGRGLPTRALPCTWQMPPWDSVKRVGEIRIRQGDQPV